MRDDQPVAHLLEIAASSLPLLERARSLVDSLDHWLPVDAIWLTLSDPGCNVYATVGSTGLEQPVLDCLDRPCAREVQLADLNRKGRRALSVTDLPIAVHELPTWAECLIPAGFREGLGVPLFEPHGPYLGMLSLLFTKEEPPSDALRNRIAQLAPLVARGISPMPSLLATARLVEGAASGVVLLRDGTGYRLPGLDGHPLLEAESLVVDIARRTLVAGQVYRSFLWPADGGPGATGHVRLTALAATDVPAYLLGTLLVTPRASCRGLTPRELEVLGLLVAGDSNQQIARRLTIALRTVAAHVEHILHKMEVPTRTLAAVQAEREGCYVPPPPRPRAAC